MAVSWGTGFFEQSDYEASGGDMDAAFQEADDAFVQSAQAQATETGMKSPVRDSTPSYDGPDPDRWWMRWLDPTEFDQKSALYYGPRLIEQMQKAGYDFHLPGVSDDPYDLADHLKNIRFGCKRSNLHVFR